MYHHPEHPDFDAWITATPDTDPDGEDALQEIEAEAADVLDDALDFASLCQSLGFEGPDPFAVADEWAFRQKWARGLLSRDHYVDGY